MSGRGEVRGRARELGAKTANINTNMMHALALLRSWITNQCVYDTTQKRTATKVKVKVEQRNKQKLKKF